MDIGNIKIKIKEFWNNYESKIILLVGFCLISALSFEAGILLGNTAQNEPIVVERPVMSQVAGANEEKPLEAQKTASSAQTEPANTNEAQNCAFVGSKNSDKYHLPTCSYAKRIKSENRVCFKDQNEAKSKGYQPDKNCIK
jgi:hypothetical protein